MSTNGCTLSIICSWFKGRTKNKGRQAVEAILVLESSMGLQKKKITQLEVTLATGDLFDITDLSEQLQDARDHYSHLDQGLRRKRAELGVNEKENFTQL